MCKYEELVQELFKNATLIKLTLNNYALSFSKSTIDLVDKMKELFPNEYEEKIKELIKEKESK